MTAARSFLLIALRRVVDGGDIDGGELDAAVPAPLSLDDDEKDAWEELSHWADDVDIRAENERYTAFKRDRMREHIAVLTSSGGLGG